MSRHPASAKGGARSRHAAALIALCSCACGTGEEELPRSFELEQTAPKSGEVFLNHPLIFSFSEPVAPTSITRESLRIASADGREARGVFRVEGRQVQFLPEPVLSPDLLDGGFLPGARYDVRVAGFPLPDGIRSVDGLPLRCTYLWSFETVPLSASPRDMFRDRTLGYSEPLRLVGSEPLGNELELVIEPEDPIAIECGEPLFPASVRAEDFSLVPLERGVSAPVPLEVELVENHDAGDPFPLGVSRLELRPAAPLAPGLYLLSFAANPSLTDLGGNLPRFWPWPIQVRVLSPVGEHVERFLDPEGRSPLPVRGADGTAWWGKGGVVTIRFPLSAGEGRDGPVILNGWEERKDVHATRLEVPAGAECELGASGLVILRAQGALRISGRLARRGGEGDPVTWEPGERLSSWLEGARAEDPAWTVLVAGGDLVIEGEVDTEGPLVLVAGGWIRASGEVRQRERQLWLLGEGGGMLLDPTRSTMDLEMDPPLKNPVAAGTELRFAVLSVPLPSEGRVGRWLAAEAHGRANAGAWRVRYSSFSAIDEEFRAVDDPRELDPAGKLRLLVELTVGAPGPERLDWGWSPPMVDEVRLHWEWDHAESR